jgi:hypothetical protein
LPDTLPLAPHVTYTIPAFDTDAMLVEIGLMLEWYLPDRGGELSAELRAQFVTMWRELLDSKAARRENLGAARLPFAQHHLARGARGHQAHRHHRFPGHGAGPRAYDWCRCCRMRASTCPSSSSSRC